MAFIPNTTYRVYSQNNSSIDGPFSSFYDAIECARTNNNAYYVKDASGNTVFTKNGTSHYHLYQFNNYYGTSDNINYSLSGNYSGNKDRMLGWLEAFEFSKAIRGDGALSNSRSRRQYLNPNVSIQDVYDKQECDSGGYYQVRTLSSGFSGNDYTGAYFDVPFKDIVTNMTSANNPYIFLGVTGNGGNCEAGLQYIRGGSWRFIRNDSSKSPSFNTVCSINTSASGATYLRVNMSKDSSSRAVFSISVLNSSKQVLSTTSTYTSGTQILTSNINHELYRSVSFCPVDSTGGSDNTTNLNCGEYFHLAKMLNCHIKIGGYMQSWPYNASFNQFAVTYNEEFIDHRVEGTDGDSITISYLGRDINGNLKT